MVDEKYDALGRRLRGVGLTPHEQILAADDHVRVNWILQQVRGAGSVLDVGAGDGSILRMVQTVTGATVFGIDRNRNIPPPDDIPWSIGDALKVLPTLDPMDVALCCEVLQWMEPAPGRRLLAAIRATTLIVTVPNRNCRSFRKLKRARLDGPAAVRDFSATSLTTWLNRSGWRVIRQVEPIVGTALDGIWLGAVCHRGRS